MQTIRSGCIKHMHSAIRFASGLQGEFIGKIRMKTTIIIPNYNGIEYLENCLISLQKCEPFDLHIIVVDNGSTDGCVELLKEKFPKVETVFLSDNTGFAPAVNRGLERVKTPYALLLNNDVTVEADFVKRMELAMDEHDSCFSVSAKMLMMQKPELLDGAGDLYCALGWAFALGKGKSAAEHYTKPAKIFSSCGGAVIYRMDILNKIGFFDENHFAYLEDVDIGYRAKIYGYDNWYEPSAVVYHAGSGFSGSRYNEFKTRLASRNSIYIILKNMPFLQILMNLPFLLLGFLTKIVFFVLKGHGNTYCKGLIKGFSLYFSEEGKKNKVPFKFCNLFNYVKIEIELLLNIARRIIG